MGGTVLFDAMERPYSLRPMRTNFGDYSYYFEVSILGSSSDERNGLKFYNGRSLNLAERFRSRPSFAAFAEE
jgi:hypothetical protein